MSPSPLPRPLAAGPRSGPPLGDAHRRAHPRDPDMEPPGDGEMEPPPDQPTKGLITCLGDVAGGTVTCSGPGAAAGGPAAAPVTDGTGTITVVADGTGLSTGSDQPSYHYGEILGQGATSGSRQWRLDMPPAPSSSSWETAPTAGVGGCPRWRRGPGESRPTGSSGGSSEPCLPWEPDSAGRCAAAARGSSSFSPRLWPWRRCGRRAAQVRAGSPGPRRKSAASNRPGPYLAPSPAVAITTRQTGRESGCTTT